MTSSQPIRRGLIGRMSLKARFALLGIIALALVAVPAVLWVHAEIDGLAAARAEARGVPAARALLDVLQRVQQHRGLAAGVLGGTASLAGAREAKQREVEASLAAADKLIASADRAPSLAAAYAKAQADWKRLANGVATRSISVAESYTAHTQLAADYLNVIELASDHFGITLDPAADGYFAGTAALMHLPQLAEALGQGRAKGAGLLATGQINAADRVYMASIRDRIADREQRARSALGKAVDANPALREKIGAPLAQATQQGAAMLRLMDEKVIHADKLVEPSAAYIAQFTQAIDAQFALVEVVLGGFDAVLVAREAALRRELTLLGAMVLLLTAAGAAFGWWIARRITSALASAGAVADAIAAGKLDNAIDSSGGDETGRLLVALNAMQDKLIHSVANFEGQIAAIGKAQAVIEFELDGTIRTANDNFLKTMGYALDEIEGKHHRMFAESQHAASAEYRAFWDKLGRGEYDAGQYKRIAKGGKEIWIQASYNPIIGPDGKPFKVVKYATDITEAKLRASDFEGQLAAVSKAQAVIEFRLDGTILTANDNFLKTMGYALDEIKGRHHRMFADTAHAAGSEYRAFWDKLGRGEFDAGQYKRVAKGGREVWIQASYNPILGPDGKPFKVVKYATDITSEVQSSLAMLAAVDQTKAAVGAAMAGDLTQRIPMEGKKGPLEELCGGVNRLLDTTSGSLEEVVRVLGALAEGDLTQRIEQDLPGTFGRLKDDSNATVAKLTSIIGQVREASEAINLAAAEVATGNTDLSQRTEEQASSLEETASSMEELTATVKQNADNARQANQLAASASEVAQKGGSVVSQVVSTMSSITDSSKKIVDIISVIDGIAFQTNILALNAAVEAARAGEQGRGFAVVASEVRNLAQRSAAAAKEIKALIGDSVEKVDVGSKLVEAAGQTMEDIVASVKRVTDIMAEISAASAEQSSGIEQVNQAITQMDQVTQQNAALVEEAAAAAESMKDQAQGLTRSVGAFRLATQGEAAPAAGWSGTERRGPNRARNVSRIATPAPAKRAAPQPAAATGTDDDWQQF